jgi:hypothetical protein
MDQSSPFSKPSPLRVFSQFDTCGGDLCGSPELLTLTASVETDEHSLLGNDFVPGDPLGHDFIPGEWDVVSLQWNQSCVVYLLLPISELSISLTLQWWLVFQQICGRGKISFDHVGNRRFRVIVAMNLTRYGLAMTRTDKSIVVNEIVNQIRDANSNRGFVKRDHQGMWYVVTVGMAREKVGHALRDCMMEPLRRNSKSTDMERRSSLKKAQDAILQTCLYPCKS